MVAIFALLLLALPSLAAETPARISEKDSGRTIGLKTGDVLEVTLAGNPTTGYSWSVASVGEILKQLGEPVFESASPGLTGAGGKVLLRFQALRPGKTVLKLAYRRIWEKKAPAATFEVTIRVR